MMTPRLVLFQYSFFCMFVCYIAGPRSSCSSVFLVRFYLWYKVPIMEYICTPAAWRAYAAAPL